MVNIQMVPMKLSCGTINEFDTLSNWLSGINQILMFSFCVYSVTYCDNKFLFMTFTRKKHRDTIPVFKVLLLSVSFTFQWSSWFKVKTNGMKNILK